MYGNMIIPKIVKSHHQVLRQWFELRHRLDSAPDVISFDSHTDTRQAFLRRNFRAAKNEELPQELIEKVKQGDVHSLEKAIRWLKNDEFIDFAIKADLIRNAYVFSWMQGVTEGNKVSITQWQTDACGTDKRIFVFSPNRMPCCCKPYSKDLSRCTQGCRQQLADLAIDDAVLQCVVEVFQRFELDLLNYILDFDCDFFLTKRALAPESDTTIGNLIRGALGVSIARESACVRDCRTDPTLTATTIVNALNGLIDKHGQSACNQQ